MKAAIALLLALSGTELAAQAATPRWNPKAPENAQILPALNLAAVGGVLDSIGARHQRTTGTPGEPTLLVTFANGRRALVALSACDRAGNGCKALRVQSSWSRLSGVAPERLAQASARFNQRYAFAKAFLLPDGQPALQRYLIADYGFVRGNLAVELQVFADQAQRFVTEVLQPLGRTRN